MRELNRKLLLEIYGRDELENLKEIVLNGLEKEAKISAIDSETFRGLDKLEVLKLNDNQIEKIDKNLFSDLSNLRELNLSINKLAKIDSDTFRGLSKLETLDLGGNYISKIDGNLFSHLSNLKKLFLFFNRLHTIDSDAFKGLVSLKILYLGWNYITEFDDNLFSGVLNLKELYLNNNQLVKINVNAFKGLTKLQKLILDNGNDDNIILKFQSLIEALLSSIDFDIFDRLNELDKIFIKQYFRLVREGFVFNARLKKVEHIFQTRIDRLSTVQVQVSGELKYLNNEIKEIDGNLFSYLSNLKSLKLNEVKKIDLITFKGLVKLDALLEEDKNLLKSLTKLEFLSININELTELDLNIFEKFKNIKHLGKLTRFK